MTNSMNAGGKTIFILNAESLGHGDDGLGLKLTANFFRTLIGIDPKPDAIIFYNAAVKMLSADSPHLDILKKLDDLGVDLLACTTCLEFFHLTEKLSVGEASNMREICQRLLLASKTITM